MQGLENDSFCVADTIDSGESIERIAMIKILGETVRETIEDVLNDKERYVVSAIFGIESPQKTINEIAEECGYTRQRISQILTKAIRKLRSPKNKSKLKGMYEISCSEM